MRSFFILIMCSFGLVGCGAAKNDNAPIYHQAQKKLQSQLKEPQLNDQIKLIEKSEQRFLIASRPEEVTAKQVLDIQTLTPQIQRQTVTRIQSLSGTKKVSVEQLPLLTRTRQGQLFLSMNSDARAFVQASPATTCPVRSTGDDLQSPVLAVQSAMNACFDALSKMGIADRCDCQLVAQNTVLLDTLEAFSYAKGVSAVLFQPNTRDLQLYIAEEAVQESPDYKLRVYSLDQELGEVKLQIDGSLQASLDQKSYIGHWYAEGYRRGHLVVRLFLQQPINDERLIMLVGYEPQDIKERFAEISQWVERE